MSSEPTKRDVEALARAIFPALPNRCCDGADLEDCPYDGHDAGGVARAVLTSGWYAARIAQARREGAAEGWTDALRWVRQYAENTTPDMAIEHIDRAEPFNPHRAALRGDA